MTDIVEYVEQKFRSGNSVPIDRSWLSADEWAQLRAEIVRLRGEVAVTKTLLCQVYTDAYHCGHHDTVEGQYTDVLPVDRDTYWLEQVTDYIAPAEAKGDALDLGEPDELTPAMLRMVTPQPADGGAVALLVRDVCELEPADPDAADTVTVRVADLERIAGCYVNPQAAHPSACELEAVRDAIQKARNIADGASACNAQGPQHQAGMRRACNIIEAALQHRGDSRGGEG